MVEDYQKKWVGGVCIQDNKILLIHRINKERLFNQEYFVFPGRNIEDDESVEGALHEIFGECGITIETGDVFYSKEDVDESEYFYLCTYLLGNLLVPPATEVSSESQFFTPMWISLSELDELIVHPESIKELILEK